MNHHSFISHNLLTPSNKRRCMSTCWRVSPRRTHIYVTSPRSFPCHARSAIKVYQNLLKSIKVLLWCPANVSEPGSRILDPRSWIHDPGSRLHDHGSRIRDPVSRIRDPVSWILDPGSWIQDPRSRIRDPGSWILDPRSWIRDPGCWIIRDPGPSGPGS